jgi:hypothetical protein
LSVIRWKAELTRAALLSQFDPLRTSFGAHLLSLAARLEAILVKNQVRDLPILIANAR